MTRLLRALVRLVRRRRYAETPARIRTLEAALGLVEQTFTEAHANPDLLDWGSGRRGRRQRERFERLDGRPAMRHTGLGQCSPKGTARPPVITAQGETPPPVHYIPDPG